MEIIKGKGFKIVGITPPEIAAPYQPDGDVVTINENKEAICTCSLSPDGCPVDARNKVIQDRHVVIYES